MELGVSRRQGPEEVLELGQIAYLADGAHVPFKIGLDITGVPQGDVPPGIRDELRIAAAQEVLPEVPVGRFFSATTGGPSPCLPRKGRVRVSG